MLWWLFLCLVLFTTNADTTSVCIIGSGIGGASTAYFVKQISSGSSIKVFEQHANVGGRVQYDNEIFAEVGASVIHRKNKYVMELIHAMNLTVEKANEAGKTAGLFDGKEFKFTTSGWKWIDAVQMLYRYGSSLWNMKSFVRKMMYKFSRIYDVQKNGLSFEDPVHMLKAMGLYEYTQETLAQVLEKNGMDSRFVHELATGINRVNYGQSGNSINGFAGAVGLAGSGDDLRMVQGGNQQLPDRLLQASGAEMMWNTTINRVEKGGASYTLHTVTNQVFHCESVVIATPLELTFMQLDPMYKQKLVADRQFQTTHTAFVRGILQPTYYGGKVPDIIMTMENPSIPFSSIGLIRYTNTTSKEGIYKLFSRTKITSEQFSLLFKQYQLLKYMPWKAYPVYHPPEQFSKFKLDGGLLYVNAIETAASAMEMSAISGKNAALLLSNYFQWEEPSGNPSIHNEL